MPRPVLQRLPQYLWYIQEQKDAGVQYVYSQEIARELGLTPSTVREDFTYLDFSGQSKRGYATERLSGVLSDLLGVHAEKRIVIVGAGNLGRALALHGNLERYGFYVRAVVDVNPRLVGTKIGALIVGGIEDLTDVVQTEKIDIGVIAVPAASAQNVADLLILAGARGLLNMAFARVVAPKKVRVVNARLISSFLQLSCAVGADTQL